MIEIGGKLKFTSGKTIEPNCGIVGINHKLEIHHGFDGDLHAEYHQHAEVDEYGGLTAGEICELADFMIARWQLAKAKAEILSPEPVKI